MFEVFYQGSLVADFDTRDEADEFAVKIYGINAVNNGIVVKEAE